MASVQVCMGEACLSHGSRQLLQDIEELAAGRCKVNVRGCMNKYCGENALVLYRAGEGTKLFRLPVVNTFKKVNHIVAAELGVEVQPLEQKVGKLKFQVRREENPKKREHLLSQAFLVLRSEGEAKEPLVYGQLLALRAHELLLPATGDIPVVEDAENALLDARQAVELLPDWPEARLMEATALESLGRYREALKSIDMVLKSDSCLDRAGVLEQRERIFRVVDAENLAIAGGSGSEAEAQPKQARTLVETKLDANGRIRRVDSQRDPKGAAVEILAKPAKDDMAADAKLARRGIPLLGKSITPVVARSSSKERMPTKELALAPEAEPARQKRPSATKQVDIPFPKKEPEADGSEKSVSGEDLTRSERNTQRTSCSPKARPKKKPSKAQVQKGEPKKKPTKAATEPKETKAAREADVQDERRVSRATITAPEKPGDGAAVADKKRFSEGRAGVLTVSTSMSIDSGMPFTEDESMESFYVPRSVEWKIERVWWLNHNCVRVRLRSMDPDKSAMTRAAYDVWHVVLVTEFAFKVSGREFKEEITRSYTPLTTLQDYKAGRMDLLVKVYLGGKMSQYLATNCGAGRVRVSPPLLLLSPEVYRLAGGLVMIAGGSAVTVALQVCQQMLERRRRQDEESLDAEILEDEDEARVELIMCNKTRRDVLFRDQLGHLIEKYPKFNLVHCISTGPLIQESGDRITWRSGQVDAEVLRRSADEGLQAAVSGPPGLCKAAVDAWTACGRREEDIKVLDELPDDNAISDTPCEAPRKQSAAERRERRERAWRGKVRQAHGAAFAGATGQHTSLASMKPDDEALSEDCAGEEVGSVDSLQASFREAARIGEMKPVRSALENKFSRMWADVRSTFSGVTPCSTCAQGQRIAGDDEDVSTNILVH